MDLHNPDQTRDVVGSNQVLNPSVMKDTRGRAIRSCFTSLTLEMVYSGERFSPPASHW